MNTSKEKATKNNRDILLEILTAFDQVCREQDIEYFLAGGNCLGAVRHKGFLPWDDDVDLYMRASVWNAKKEILRDALPQRYELNCREFNPYYGNPVIRIVDRETTQISRSRITDRSGHGVQIEIFLLDPLPDDKQLQQVCYEDFWLYCEVLSTTSQRMTGGIRLTEQMIDKYHLAMERVKAGQRDQVLAELEARLFCYEEESCEEFHLRWGSYWITFPKEAFRQKLVAFEDRMFPIPEDFPKVLYAEYGDDWMMIPDASGIWGHDTIENLQIPYEIYEKRFEKEIDLDAYRKTQETNKQFKMERSFRERTLGQTKAAHLKALALSQIHKAEGKEMFRTVQNQLFDEHTWIGAEEDRICGFLRDFFLEGDLKFLRKFAVVYDGEHEGIRRLLQDVGRFRKIRDAFYLGQGKDVLRAAEELAGEYPGQVDLEQLICRIAIEDGDAGEQARSRLAKGLAEHGDLPGFRKAQADLKLLDGDRDGAREIYEDLAEHSRDGMIRLESRKILAEGEIHE